MRREVPTQTTQSKASSSALNRSALESMVKRESGIDRVGPKTFDFLEEFVNQMIGTAARAAGAMAQAEKRTTLLARDVEAGLAKAGVGSATREPTADAVFTQLDRLPTDQLAVLIRRLEAWLAESRGHR